MQSSPEATPHLDKFAYLKAATSHPGLIGKHAAFRVLVVIWNHADGELCNSWPSLATIANEGGMSKSTAAAGVSWLRSNGFLMVECEATRNTSTRYSMVLPRVPIAGTPCTYPRYTRVPISGTEQIHEHNHEQIQSGEAAHDAPSSHLADSDLSVATTRSAVQHEGHGEDEHEEQDELSSGTSGDAVPPVAAGASQEQAKEGAVDPRRLNGRALLAYHWGEDAAARAVQLSMQCAGGLMSEELLGLLSDLDDEFADWCSDYGSRIASRAAWSEREAAGILASKLRTFDRGIWLAA